LEVTESVYSADLERATNSIYLSLWLGSEIENAQARAQALDALFADAKVQLVDLANQLKSILSNDIPNLQGLLDDIGRSQSLLVQELSLREQQLKALADAEAAQKEAAAKSISAIHLFAAVLSLVPVAQPAGAILGAALDGIANKDDLWTIVKNAGSAYFTNGSYEQSFVDLVTNLNGLDFSSIDSLEDTLKAVPQGQKDPRSTLIRKAGGAVYSKATEVLSKKATDTVPADLAQQILQQYEQADPEYQSYVNDGKELLLKKQDAFSKLQDMQQHSATLAQEILKQTSAVGATLDALRVATVAADAACGAAIDSLRRNAQLRLKRYLYLIALAFEYRLLQPFSSALDVNLNEKQLEDAAKGTGVTLTPLTPAQVKGLMNSYQNPLAQIAKSIVETYESHKSLDIPHQRPIALTDSELKRLGSGQPVEINFVDRPEFHGASEKNRRITSAFGRSMTIAGLKPPTIDVLIRHGGISVFTIDSKAYGFRHLGYDGASEFTWRSTYASDTNSFVPQPSSPPDQSLLLSLLNIPSDKLDLFAAPGLDATVVVTIEPADAKIQISELTILLEYTYQQA